MSEARKTSMRKPPFEWAEKPKILYLLGPTGVGKTDAALSVAAALQGEIISADSMQVYRYMDIGTAKPTPEQRRGIPHHLIDVVDPDQPFDAALFREHAIGAVRGILSRGNRVVVCGGTGLYLKALGQGLFHGPGRDERIRRDLRESIRRKGLEYVVEQLRRVDAVAGSRIDPHDERRVVRAMEVFLLTGKPLSEWHREHRFEDKPFTILKIGLERPRALLYIRINRRCDAMVKAGLLDEVASLLDRGYAPELPSLQGVGYRQMIEQLKGRLAPEDAIALMKRDTRRLAKRQMTWFRADPNIVWVSADDVERIKEYCHAFFEDS